MHIAGPCVYYNQLFCTMHYNVEHWIWQIHRHIVYTLPSIQEHKEEPRDRSQRIGAQGPEKAEAAPSGEHKLLLYSPSGDTSPCGFLEENTWIV